MVSYKALNTNKKVDNFCRYEINRYLCSGHRDGVFCTKETSLSLCAYHASKIEVFKVEKGWVEIRHMEGVYLTLCS